MNKTTLPVLILLGITVLLGVILFLTYPDNVKHRKLDRHEFLTPPALAGHAEWQSLIADWRSLQKLDSWTPEYSRAEDALKRRYRQFLVKDLSETENVLDIPIIAIALQSTRITIEHHHTRVGSLDWSKASFDRLQIMNVAIRDLVPEQIDEIAWRILRVEDVIEDAGVDVAAERLAELESELSVIKNNAYGEPK